jgi:hypothetical protein
LIFLQIKNGGNKLPVVKVWRLPKLSEKELNWFCQLIENAVERISELGLMEQNAITVLFPPDSMKNGLGEEIIVEVTGLFRKPERTPAVCQRLARELGQVVAQAFPKAKVECFIYLFDPAEGFWSSSE